MRKSPLPRLLGLITTLLVFSACHPLGCYHPKDLPTDRPREIQSDADFPGGDVEIILDDFGIPHIFGDDEVDNAYGLGYMHARDRSWQMLLIKHFAQGRVSELFGEDFLDADRFLRLISFPAERTEAALSERGRRVLESYAAGVNQAAIERGPTAEMDILGVEFGTWTVFDSITIMFFFVDDQSLGFRPEIARQKILNRLPKDSPVAQLLLSGSSAGGVPIVTEQTHSGAPLARTARTQQHPLVYQPAERQAAAPFPSVPARARAVFDRLMNGPGGHSNSWSVHGSLTASGAPILANDPHLGHQMPGTFYLAHLESDDYTAAGATISGTPVVLIGHGRDVAWGITNAFGDCQDVVKIEPFEGRDDLYNLDGRPQNYGSIVQQYRVGVGEDAPIFEETWRTTVFGPVIPPGAQFLVDEGDTLAYQWCADKFATEMAGNFDALLDLPRATNVAEADAAMAQWVAPPLSFNMAFTDGTIAFRPMGFFPERRSSEPIHLPRDGRFSDARFGEPIPYAQKPQLTNPEAGFIVASNQRIVDDDSPRLGITGREGANADRAQRITDRLVELLGQKRPSADDLLDIQQDITSVEAREIASILGDACPTEIDGHPRQRVLGFCTAIRNFNGVFSVDALGALPYQFLMTDLVKQVMIAHLGEDIGRHAGTRGRVREAIVQEAAGELSPLFDDPATTRRDGLAVFVARSAKVALDRLTGKCEGCKNLGDNPIDWRWGKAHTLTYENTLKSAPVIGGLFKTAAFEESGCKQCPRAEGPVPVTSGAGLRLIAEMTDPPSIRMIGDLGQVGHFGHRNSEDMRERWSAGEPIEVPIDRATIESKNTGWLTIRPR